MLSLRVKSMMSGDHFSWERFICSTRFGAENRQPLFLETLSNKLLDLSKSIHRILLNLMTLNRSAAMINLRKYILGSFLAVFISFPSATNAGELQYGFQVEEFEYRLGEHGEDFVVWDIDAFIGTDEVKLRWTGYGDYALQSDYLGVNTNKLVVQMPVSGLWHVKGGVRWDRPDGEDRWYGTIGVTALAARRFEVDTDFYISENGDTSVIVDAEYEWLLTNNLILISSTEIMAAFSSDPEIGVESGVNYAEAGLRLGYKLPDLAISPYVGVLYERKFGKTADLAEAYGQEMSALQFVIGSRLQF